MPRVESTASIITTKVGRPDYSGETWQSANIQKIELHENETIIAVALCGSAVASPFPYVVPAILAGVETAAIDTDTGLVMPYIVPAGYELELMQYRNSWTQNTRVRGYILGFFNVEYYSDAMEMYVEQLPFEWSSKYVDPTFTIPIPLLFTIENLGLAAMTGFTEVIAILRRHHTEVFTTKPIRCKFCGDITTVPRSTTKNKCVKCGNINLYFTHSSMLMKGGIK